MRFSELSDHQRSLLIEEFASLRTQGALELRSRQRYIAACFIGAGFCVFGCIDAIMAGPAMSAAARLFAFALGFAYFFGTAWRKFTSHNSLVRAGERAYLALMFDSFGKDGIEFSTQDVANFLLSAPDRPTDVTHAHLNI